jgi:hypothetical protein
VRKTKFPQAVALCCLDLFSFAAANAVQRSNTVKLATYIDPEAENAK